MALYQVPLPKPGSEPNFSETVSLGGVDFELRFSWNERDEHWYLDIKREDAFVLAGWKLCYGEAIGSGHKDALMPGGILIILDTDGSREDPTFDSLGDTTRLCYLESPEDLP